jgi:hypothetical protein
MLQETCILLCLHRCYRELITIFLSILNCVQAVTFERLIYNSILHPRNANCRASPLLLARLFLTEKKTTAPASSNAETHLQFRG